MTSSPRPPRTLDAKSFAAFRVDQLYNGHLIGHGTCFLRRRAGRSFLITNWHIATARDPTNPASSLRTDPALGLPGTPGSPHALRVHFTRLHEGHLVVGQMDVPLYDGTTPRWVQHQRGHGIDVVAMEIDAPEGVTALEDLKLNDKMRRVVNSDVVVLGFPYALDGGAGSLPIWKRGSIASEPELDIVGEPKMFVDTACRPGMSGSPAFTLATGMVDEESGDSALYAGGPQMRFLGVFAGAIADATRIAQLGIVWKAPVVDEILNAPAAGTNPYPP